MLTSLSCGFVLVFVLSGSSASSTSSTGLHTVDPIIDFVLGGLILLIGRGLLNL